MLILEAFSEGKGQSAMHPARGIPPISFLAPCGFTHPLTRTHVRLLGPRFKMRQMGCPQTAARSKQDASLNTIRFPPENFKHSLPLFSKSFSSFPHAGSPALPGVAVEASSQDDTLGSSSRAFLIAHDARHITRDPLLVVPFRQFLYGVSGVLKATSADPWSASFMVETRMPTSGSESKKPNDASRAMPSLHGQQQYGPWRPLRGMQHKKPNGCSRKIKPCSTTEELCTHGSCCSSRHPTTCNKPNTTHASLK
ncbi:hypothetical protein L2E82_35678 [Cichorium intybus]|uniref:Uncharacterized protein n=1 Tax=Cichorium intybus TaxID=13427 RepID=A0ACB9BPF4_CICIN|nr:hypothetical protein L2E82_35678 [Cichorium intybus]